MSIGKRMRFAVFSRDGFTCQYCGGKPPDVILEVDHIIPRARGGQDSIYNYLTACFDCNRGKHTTKLSQLLLTINSKPLPNSIQQEPLRRYNTFSKEEWLQLARKFGGWHTIQQMKYLQKHGEVKDFTKTEQLREYAKSHPELSLNEIGRAFNISASRVWRILYSNKGEGVAEK